MRVLNLLSHGPLDYLEVDRLQRFVHGEVAAERVPDTLILWEAQPVYTAGRRTKAADIPNRDIPVIQMDRGGSVTFHGPGQLVVYPIIRVRPPQDVVAFVRNTETALISALTEIGISTSQVPGRSGVWVQRPGVIDRKLCAIGIKFAAETTMHGIALNVTTDTSQFQQVVPCGISDAGVVSLQELGIDLSLPEVAELIVPALASTYQNFARREYTPLTTMTAAETATTREQAAQAQLVVPAGTGIRWQAQEEQ
ncbi:MAG: lipoyl(octanoyl) transferase LipB [Trueperella sp.]|nr:lipoyl(octanoyl) transferase LipB [Trueperella sp.]